MHALDVLEFGAICERLASQCETAPGRALASALLPSFDPDQVSLWIEQTTEAVDLLDAATLSLRGVHDLARPLDYAGKGGVLDGESLFRAAELLRVSREAKTLLGPQRHGLPRLKAIAHRLTLDSRTEQRLYECLESDGAVKSEASPMLASAREKKVRLSQKLQERINSYVSGKTREWLSDPVVTQRAGRFVIPLKAENRGKIKGIIHDTSSSGLTLYVEPEDVVRAANDLREAEAQERTEVEKVLAKLSGIVGAFAALLIENVEALASLDLILAKARLGFAMKAVAPLRQEGAALSVRNARHPLLDPAAVVPCSLELGREFDSILITGPNTGGKTVAIKAIGLMAAMAQAGLMCPADEVRIGCFSQLWADIGDEQSLQQSLSTFSAHIRNIAAAVNGLKKGALVLLDEIGAGTDPAEGSALARAVLLDLQKRGARVLASTHYGELKVFAANTPGFVNASMEFDRKSLRPTYRLMVGVPGSSHALHIASRYGMPDRVLKEAEASGGVLEQDIAAMIDRLEQAQKQALASQSRADKLAAEVARVKKEAERKLNEAQEIRNSIRSRAAEELQEVLRLIRLEAAQVFEEVKKDPTGRGLERAREKLRELNEAGQEFVKEMQPSTPRQDAPRAGDVVKGATVQIGGLGQKGTVAEEPKGGKVVVQIGPMKMTVNLDQIKVLEGPKAASPIRSKGVHSITLEKAQTARPEVVLVQMRAEAAQETLDRFLDDAVLGGLPFIRIVHGKGEGVLRSLVQETLRRHPHVKSFGLADASEGGPGVTIARFG